MNKWSNYGKWRHPEKRKELMKIDVEDFNNKAQHIIDTVVKPQVERYEQAKKQKETMTEEELNNPPYISDDFQIGPDGAYEAVEYSIPIYENGVKTEWSVDGIIGDKKYFKLLELGNGKDLPDMINTTTKQ